MGRANKRNYTLTFLITGCFSVGFFEFVCFLKTELTTFSLPDEKKEYVLSKQLLKSGTSIGANIAEANCAFSKKDFLAKMYIAFKECAETEYWLELLFDSGVLNEKEFQSMIDDCREIKK